MTKAVIGSICIFLLVATLANVAYSAEDKEEGYAQQAGETSQEQGVDENMTAQNQDRLRQQHQTVWFACFVITKNYMNQNNQLIFESLKGGKSQIYHKKLVAKSLLNCLARLQFDEANKFLESIQKQGGLGSIDLQSYFQYLAIDLAAFREGKVQGSLTKEELSIFNAAEELEKNLAKQQKGEGGQDEDESSGQGSYKFEPNIFGVNLKDISTGTRMLYMLGIFGALAAVFYIGYQYLFPTGPRNQAEKLALERKQKKEAKKAGKHN